MPSGPALGNGDGTGKGGLKISNFQILALFSGIRSTASCGRLPFLIPGSTSTSIVKCSDLLIDPKILSQ